MKRLMILTLCLVLLLPLFASATVDVASLTDEQLNALAAQIASEQLSRAKGSGEYLLSGTYDGVTLGLKDVLTVDDGGKKVLLLVFDFSHEKDEAQSFLLAASIKVFQDGIEQDTSYYYDHPSSGNGMKEIKKGATLEVVKAFDLSSGSPIEIEMNELFNFDGRKPDVLTMNVP